ncbi:MAG: branched-chain amino acid transport system ATP-binding protein livF [Actinomycetota bacterium]
MVVVNDVIASRIGIDHAAESTVSNFRYRGDLNLLALLKRKFESDTKGEWIFPLVVLSALYFFDEFDTSAFGTLAPEIRHAFHLSVDDFTKLIIINVSVTVLLAVPVGYLGDRVNRTKLVVVSGIVAAMFSFGTGIAGTVALLTFARFGNGVGLLANIPVHNSLLADYYTPQARPTVYANHSNAVQVAAIIAPAIAGLIAWQFGWRAAFFLLFIPVIIATVFAMRLHEPVRGATDPGGGELREFALPPKFWEASKVLWAVKTLRRSFIAATFVGAGFIPLVGYIALYFEKVYHLTVMQRGALGSVSAVFAYFGVQEGGKRTAGWFAQGMGVPVKRIGVVLALVGVGVICFAAAPWLWLSLVFAMGTNFVIGMFAAPLAAIQALVSPARERSLAFSFGAIFLVLGVVIFEVLGFAKIADTHGLRWGVGVLAPWFFIGGAIAFTAHKFVESDVQAAMLKSAAEAEAARAEYEAKQAITTTEEDSPSA